mmetsp:Transcript_20320/g.34010  ORF Transcript_20320/g.34010 Transcript_20320/m.34010 type:complete len:335 (+) Transcript_20320:71-1075(+)
MKAIFAMLILFFSVAQANNVLEELVSGYTKDQVDNLQAINTLAGSPTLEPTAEPTPMPSCAPSTAMPTYAPSTAMPTYAPSTAMPTYAPSTVMPTYAPSTAMPTYEPTYQPTSMPSSQPSTAPTNTHAPTVKPSATPTAMPTEFNVVSFVTSQDLNGLTEAEYQQDLVANNQSVQEAVSSVMNETSPSDITNIETEDISDRRLRSNGRKLASSAVRLTYLVFVRDDAVTYDSLTNQLKVGTEDGSLDAALKFFAQANGATQLVALNATFGEPTTENSFSEGDASDDLTGAQIAGLLVGIFLLIALIALIVMFATSSPESPPVETPAPAPPADEL